MRPHFITLLTDSMYNVYNNVICETLQPLILFFFFIIFITWYYESAFFSLPGCIPWYSLSAHYGEQTAEDSIFLDQFIIIAAFDDGAFGKYQNFIILF